MDKIDFDAFIIIAGILVTIQVIWAQFWLNQGRTTEDKRRQASATVGLYWTYIAIIMAMVSLALFLMDKYWEGGLSWTVYEWGIGFFITSFLMGMINMMESSYSLLRRVLKGKTAFDYVGIDPAKLNLCLLLKIAGIVILPLLTVSLLGVLLTHWWFWGYMVVVALACWQFWNLIKE